MSSGGPLISADQLAARVGASLGASRWVQLDQVRLDVFGAVTDDLEPLHNDAAWCAKNSPYGRPIAHGFLTLSLLTRFLHQVTANAIAGDRGRLGFPLNYGFDRVRFMAPVPVGSRVRCGFDLIGSEARADGLLLRFKATVEIEGEEKPALVAEWLTLWVEGPDVDPAS